VVEEICEKCVKPRMKQMHIGRTRQKQEAIYTTEKS